MTDDNHNFERNPDPETDDDRFYPETTWKELFDNPHKHPHDPRGSSTHDLTFIYPKNMTLTKMLVFKR